MNNAICPFVWKIGAGVIIISMLVGCAETNPMGAVDSGVDTVMALALSEDDVKAEARDAAEEMDRLNEVAPEDSEYSKRLARLTEGLESYDGLKLNFKVYLVTDINAFAMPDGTVRVFSSLMDLMEDDELMAIIGHEIGHVKFKHSFAQMRTAMLTQIGKNLIGQTGGYPGALASSKLGQLAYNFINAQYSQSDELESDAFAVTFLRQQNMDPNAAVQAIQVLQNEFGDSNHFLGSHPSNPKRIEKLKQAIAEQD